MSKPRIVLCVVGLALAVCAGNAQAALIHYWGFEDASAGSTATLADTVNSYASKAPGAVATPLNTNAYAQQVDAATGHSGKSIKFPSYGGYNAAAATSFGSTFTMEGWFRVDGYGCNGNNRLLWGWGGVVGIHLNSSTLLATVVGGVTQVSGVWPAPGNPGTGQWVYLAVVANAPAATVTTYISRPGDAGALVQVSQSTTYNGSSTWAGGFWLGDLSKYTGANSMDDIAVWDAALTPTELTSHMTNLDAALNAPEPATMGVLALGGLAVLLRRRRR